MGSSLFVGYFQFIPHSGSEKTILRIDLLFATDILQRNGEKKTAVNLFCNDYVWYDLDEKRNSMTNQSDTNLQRAFMSSDNT